MTGNSVFPSGWSSPSSVNIPMNSESSLYDGWAINVVAYAVGSSPPLPSTTTDSIENKIASKPLLMPVPPNADISTRIQVTADEDTENYYHIPPNSAFNFKSGSHLCPVSPCEQEFF